MKFSSIRGYFERLHNILYLIIITPLLLFGYLYLQRQSPATGTVDEVILPELSLVLSVLFGAIMAFSFGWFSTRLKKCRNLTELRDKLSSYATATIVRFVLIAIATFVLAAGYLFTYDKLFVALFGINIILFSWWWPTPRKVCRNLQLKGEEHQKVLLRKDS